MEKLLPSHYERIHPKIEGVHSEDPLRKEKVQAMREKEIPILLTTTILERGVTFPKLDVAVFGAEDRIFTESALVQIAGRVGRSSELPERRHHLFSLRKNKRHGQSPPSNHQNNKEARKKGMIDD